MRNGNPFSKLDTQLLSVNQSVRPRTNLQLTWQIHTNPTDIPNESVGLTHVYLLSLLFLLEQEYNPPTDRHL